VDIAEWLHGLGLQQYEQAFCDNAIDDAVLPELTADDLKGPRCKPRRTSSQTTRCYRRVAQREWVRATGRG
jgi:hypothetical protein